MFFFSGRLRENVLALHARDGLSVCRCVFKLSSLGVFRHSPTHTHHSQPHVHIGREGIHFFLYRSISYLVGLLPKLLSPLCLFK